MEKFASRKCYKLGTAFQKPFAYFISELACPAACRDKASSVGVPKPPSYLPAGMAPELPLCSASDHTHKFQSSSIWSQVFLSLDYFKQVFNTTLESLSQQVGCCLPVASASPLRWGKGKIKQKCLPKGNEEIVFPMK